MRFILMLLFSLLACSGCRFSVGAKDLALHVGVDEPGHLSPEDPTMYEAEPDADSDPVD